MAAPTVGTVPATLAEPHGLDDLTAVVTDLVGDRAGAWDVDGELPLDLLQTLGARGILCAEVPVRHGGPGLDSATNGELTAHTGALCSSVRSIMTSQGIAATAVRRFGDRAQRTRFLRELTSGRLAAVGFSEPEAGSDLTAMRTTVRVESDGTGRDEVVVDGRKMWVTGSRYADLLVILGRFGSGADSGAAAVIVPRDAAGVRIDPVPNPLGCRAAGHCDVQLDEVRLPLDHLLGGGGHSLPLLFTTALSYGRMSVAWGCAGIVRACLAEASRHARDRRQSGRPLSDHQLVSRHLAELLVAEQVVTHVCRHASRCVDTASPEMVVAAVLAKHVGATNAAGAASTAVQVLASAGARDGHVAARAYRDAKCMEIIEGSNEISQLILAQHALGLA